jgi:hypothetical protein
MGQSDRRHRGEAGGLTLFFITTSARSSWIVRKYLVEIAAAVEHPNDLGPVIDNTIENDVRACGERMQSAPNLVANAARKWMLFESCYNAVDISQQLVRCCRSGNTSVVVPDIVEIVEGFRRPESRSPKSGHTARSCAGLGPQHPIPDLCQHQVNGRLHRYRHARAEASRHAIGVCGRSAPDRRQEGFRPLRWPVPGS